MGKKTLPTGRRMVKGKQWVSSYTGQHIVKAYRKQFGVDRMTAINDLHSIGVIDDQEFERLRKTEEERIATLRKQREEKALEAWQKTHEDQDSRFYFTLMLLSLSAAIAQDESRSNSENHHWSNRRRVEMGIYKIGNNQVLGYDADKDGKPVPNKDAWIVKMIFELYAEGKGIFELADIVNAAGAHCLRTDKPITHKQIAYMLRNEINAGDKLLQKNHPKDLRTKLPDPKREQKSNLVFDDHEPIVDRDLWNRVQERLKDPGRKPAPRRDSHSLAGKIICAECGEPFLRKTIKGHTRERENIKVWKCKGWIHGKCNAPIIKENELIDLIENES